jgi:hypothetical protein
MWKKLAVGMGLTVIGEKIYEKNKDVIDPVAKAGVDATRKALKGTVKVAKKAYDKYNEPVKEGAKKAFEATKKGINQTVDMTKKGLDSLKDENEPPEVPKDVDRKDN